MQNAKWQYCTVQSIQLRHLGHRQYMNCSTIAPFWYLPGEDNPTLHAFGITASLIHSVQYIFFPPTHPRTRTLSS